MANLKIIRTTGSPFTPACRDKIAYETSSNEWNVYRDGSWSSQTCYSSDSYRPATAEEIAEHWKVLHPKWTPEPGDRVIVTQDIGKWCNKKGTIVQADGSEYWIVKRDDDGYTTNFMKQNQMILAPYEESAKPVEAPKPTSPESKHGFTIGDVVIPISDNLKGRQCIVKVLSSSSIGVHCPSGIGLGHTLDGHCPDNTGWWYHPSSLELVSKEEPEIVSKPSTPSTPTIPIPKEGYVTVRVFTEEEFRSKGLWNSRGYPEGWNNDGEMNKYLGTYIQLSKSKFDGSSSFRYEDWHFAANNYEVIHEVIETKPEPKPETTSKSGMITVRFFTETEFKAKDKWDTYGSCPEGWIKSMNGYLGQTVDIKKSDIQIDKGFYYHGWLFGFNDYEILTPGHESKSSPKVETKVEPEVKPKEPEMKKQRFKVGDRVTYKSRDEFDGVYCHGGTDQGGYVGRIESYGPYNPTKQCYNITVSTKEGGSYNMIESEFYEYDGTYPGAVTLGTVTLGTSAGSDLRIISAGTANTTFLGTVGLQIHQTVPKSKDDLSHYNQLPVLIHKKPTKRLVVVDAY